MSVVGIDFGDENLTVAVARRAGIDVLQNEVGKRKTRSGLSYGRIQRFVGDEFTNQYLSNAVNSVVYAKRLIGKMFNDPEVQHEQKFLPCKLVPDSKGRVAIQIKHLGRDRIINPEQVMATLLSKIRRVVEDNSEGTKMRDCVVAVPSYFTDCQRRGVLDAANVAGLKVLRLINETTAIALQYGMGRPIPEPRTVIFYDMGVSSTDVAMITISGTGLKVECVASDRMLGGRDLDEALAEHLAVQILAKYKLDVKTNLRAWLRLRREADRIKQTLSANIKVPYNIEYLMNDIDVSGMVTREELNGMLEERFKQRLLAPLQYVVEKSGIAIENIHSMELLGGSTRIPYFQQLLKDSFPLINLAKTCDADESVCRGATLQCAMLSSSFKVKEYEVNEVVPYSIKATWASTPNASKSLPIADIDSANSIDLVEIFAKPSAKILTVKDCELPITVSIKYQDRNLPSFPAADPTIARFLVSAPAGVHGFTDYKVKLKIRIEPNLTCMVTEAHAVQEKEMEVEEDAPVAEGMTDGAAVPAEKIRVLRKMPVKTPLDVLAYYPFTLLEEDLTATKALEFDFVEADRIVFETAEARNELESYIFNMRSRVQEANDLGKFFGPGEVEHFVQKLNAEELWLEEEGFDEPKDVYVTHLSILKALGEDALTKFKELDLRGETLDAFHVEINKIKQWATATEPRFAHISAEDRAKIIAKCDEIVNNVQTAAQKQDQQPPTAPLTITNAKIQNSAVEAYNFARPIMNKPAPKPEPKKEEPKKEAPAPEAAPAADAPAADVPAAEGAPTEDTPAAEEAPMSDN